MLFYLSLYDHVLVVRVVVRSRRPRDSLRRIERVIGRREVDVELVGGHQTGDGLLKLEELEDVHLVAKQTNEGPGGVDTDRVHGVAQLVQKAVSIGQQHVDRALDTIQRPGVAHKAFEEIDKT